ncbi:MAG: flagellar hook-length control protein FliK, partial [Pseudobutyrivibrio sp.]|nr:flagellar hook-length control protein FliK [Pseudobutyrivibrio sp.]
LLNKYDLPVSIGNANMFEAYAANSARIANDMNNLITGLTDSISYNIDTKECINLNKEIIDSFNVIPKEDIIARTSYIVEEIVNLSDKSLDTIGTNAFTESIAIDKNDSNAVILDNKYEYSKIADDITNLMPSADNTVNESEENSLLTKTDTFPLIDGKIANILSDKDVIRLEEIVVNLTKSQNLSDSLIKEGIIDKSGNLDKSVTVDMFLNKIVDIIDNNGETVDLNAIKELITSQPYKKLLSSFITDNLTMEPKDIIKPAKVNEFFEKVMKETEEVSKIISHINDKTAEVIKDSVVNIRENITFMNEANQLYNFVQLPLKMYNQTTDSQLYVFKNKKTMGQQEDELSAFLHFEMEHLGSTDIYVLLKNKDVNCKWYLEDERSLDLINDNIEILNERLRSKGYNCTMNITQGQKRADFVEDLLKSDITNSSSSVMVHRYSFDMRA